MPYLAIDPNMLKTYGSVFSSPTMLLAAVITPVAADAEVTIIKCYYGQHLIDLIDLRKSQGLSAVVALFLLSPPRVNKTERWKVDLIADLGRTQICDRQGARFTTYAYRTTLGLVYIDNALPDPTYIKRWRSVFQLSNINEMDDAQSQDFRRSLALHLEKIANDVLLNVEAEVLA